MALSGANIVILDSKGKDKKKVSVTTDTVSIGSDLRSEVRIYNKDVEPCHCLISIGRHQVMIENKSVNNPSTVNGKMFNSRPLKTGDIVKVATCSMRWEYVANSRITLGGGVTRKNVVTPRKGRSSLATSSTQNVLTPGKFVSVVELENLTPIKQIAIVKPQVRIASATLPVSTHQRSRSSFSTVPRSRFQSIASQSMIQEHRISTGPSVSNVSPPSLEDSTGSMRRASVSETEQLQLLPMTDARLRTIQTPVTKRKKQTNRLSTGGRCDSLFNTSTDDPILTTPDVAMNRKTPKMRTVKTPVTKRNKQTNRLSTGGICDPLPNTSTDDPILTTPDVAMNRKTPKMNTPKVTKKIETTLVVNKLRTRRTNTPITKKNKSTVRQSLHQSLIEAGSHKSVLKVKMGKKRKMNTSKQERGGKRRKVESNVQLDANKKAALMVLASVNVDRHIQQAQLGSAKKKRGAAFHSYSLVVPENFNFGNSEDGRSATPFKAIQTPKNVSWSVDTKVNEAPATTSPVKTPITDVKEKSGKYSVENMVDTPAKKRSATKRTLKLSKESSHKSTLDVEQNNSPLKTPRSVKRLNTRKSLKRLQPSPKTLKSANLQIQNSDVCKQTPIKTRLSVVKLGSPSKTPIRLKTPKLVEQVSPYKTRKSVKSSAHKTPNSDKRNSTLKTRKSAEQVSLNKTPKSVALLSQFKTPKSAKSSAQKTPNSDKRNSTLKTRKSAERVSLNKTPKSVALLRQFKTPKSAKSSAQKTPNSDKRNSTLKTRKSAERVSLNKTPKSVALLSQFKTPKSAKSSAHKTPKTDKRNSTLKTPIQVEQFSPIKTPKSVEETVPLKSPKSVKRVSRFKSESVHEISQSTPNTSESRNSRSTTKTNSAPLPGHIPHFHVEASNVRLSRANRSQSNYVHKSESVNSFTFDLLSPCKGTDITLGNSTNLTMPKASNSQSSTSQISNKNQSQSNIALLESDLLHIVDTTSPCDSTSDTSMNKTPTKLTNEYYTPCGISKKPNLSCSVNIAISHSTPLIGRASQNFVGSEVTDVQTNISKRSLRASAVNRTSGSSSFRIQKTSNFNDDSSGFNVLSPARCDHGNILKIDLSRSQHTLTSYEIKNGQDSSAETSQKIIESLHSSDNIVSTPTSPRGKRSSLVSSHKSASAKSATELIGTPIDQSPIVDCTLSTPKCDVSLNRLDITNTPNIFTAQNSAPNEIGERRYKVTYSSGSKSEPRKKITGRSHTTDNKRKTFNIASKGEVQVRQPATRITVVDNTTRGARSEPRTRPNRQSTVTRRSANDIVNYPSTSDDSIKEKKKVTPKTNVKLLTEIAVKQKHSTAKKPLGRKSLNKSIHLNAEAGDMVKQLFKSPRSSKKYSLNTSMSDTETENAAKDVGNDESALFSDTSQNFEIQLNLSGVESMLDSSYENRSLQRNKTHEKLNRSLRGASSGNKQLSSNKIASKLPKNDLTDVRGVKQLLGTPGPAQKSPKNDLTDVRGVRCLLGTPGPAQKSPKNDLTDFRGVKRLLGTPGPAQKSPKNDLTDVRGVKQLVGTPRPTRRSPTNDLTNISGVADCFVSLPPQPDIPSMDETFDRLINKVIVKRTYGNRCKSLSPKKADDNDLLLGRKSLGGRKVDINVADWLADNKRATVVLENETHHDATADQGSPLKSKSVQKELSRLVTDMITPVDITVGNRSTRLRTVMTENVYDSRKESRNVSRTVENKTPLHTPNTQIERSKGKLSRKRKLYSVDEDNAMLLQDDSVLDSQFDTGGKQKEVEVDNAFIKDSVPIKRTRKASKAEGNIEPLAVIAVEVINAHVIKPAQKELMENEMVTSAVQAHEIEIQTPKTMHAVNKTVKKGVLVSESAEEEDESEDIIAPPPKTSRARRQALKVHSERVVATEVEAPPSETAHARKEPVKKVVSQPEVECEEVEAPPLKTTGARKRALKKVVSEPVIPTEEVEAPQLKTTRSRKHQLKKVDSEPAIPTEEVAAAPSKTTRPRKEPLKKVVSQPVMVISENESDEVEAPQPRTTRARKLPLKKVDFEPVIPTEGVDTPPSKTIRARKKPLKKGVSQPVIVIAQDESNDIEAPPLKTTRARKKELKKVVSEPVLAIEEFETPLPTTTRATKQAVKKVVSQPELPIEVIAPGPKTGRANKRAPKKLVPEPVPAMEDSEPEKVAPSSPRTTRTRKRAVKKVSEPVLTTEEDEPKVVDALKSTRTGKMAKKRKLADLDFAIVANESEDVVVPPTRTARSVKNAVAKAVVTEVNVEGEVLEAALRKTARTGKKAVNKLQITEPVFKETTIEDHQVQASMQQKTNVTKKSVFFIEISSDSDSDVCEIINLPSQRGKAAAKTITELLPIDSLQQPSTSNIPKTSKRALPDIHDNSDIETIIPAKRVLRSNSKAISDDTNVAQKHSKRAKK